MQEVAAFQTNVICFCANGDFKGRSAETHFYKQFMSIMNPSGHNFAHAAELLWHLKYCDLMEKSKIQLDQK